MTIGELDRKIAIYSYTTAPDGAGQPIKTRVLFATVFAAVNYNPSIESTHADTRTATTKIAFTIRHLAGLLEKMEILINSQYYAITSIQPFGRNEGMTVQAERVDI